MRALVADSLKMRGAFAAKDRTSGLASWTGLVIAVIAATVLLFGIDIVFHVPPPGVAGPFQEFSSCSVFFGAAALCLSKSRSSGDERSVWRVFALAMVLWGAGALLISRIVAVCDAYQAMISTRAYQPARDSSEAVSELRRCSGTQFDPDVVEAFVSALGTAEDGAAHPPGLQAVGSPVPA